MCTQSNSFLTTFQKSSMADNNKKLTPRELISYSGEVPGASRKLYFLSRFIERRNRWTLTWTGKLLFLALVTILAVTCTRALCQFLAITNRTGGEFLVVEGWLPAYAYREAVAEFRRGAYKKIIAAGTITNDGETEDSREFFAEGTLVRFGISSDQVVTASCKGSQRDRTFCSALAVKQWLHRQESKITAIDIVTLGPHARRTRLLYEKAIGDEAKVGIIALNDRRFNPNHWWQTSEGVRAVIGEAIAYIYVRVFFTT
jgi:hypothetical protein